jgi:tetratricopeptide (TPR) repeat protein
MRNLLVMVAILAVAGCAKKKDSEAQKQPETPAQPAGSAPAPEPAPKVAEPAPAANDYDKKMAEGDQFESQKKWTEALASFEAAAAAKPKDARALAEVGFTAYFAGNLARAKEASEQAIEAAGSDAKLKGSALFNLGLAIEKTAQNAAASLYSASAKLRPNATVQARLARLVRDEPVAVRKGTPEGDELLKKLAVAPIKLPPRRKPSTPLDAKLMDALAPANLNWEGAAGKSVVMVGSVECTETTAKPPVYECSNPQLSGKDAQALVENLVARKIAAKTEGDKKTYKVASVKCTSYDVETDDGRLPPDICDVTK